jgi:tetratricopeptide (TPR) repeat protein
MRRATLVRLATIGAAMLVAARVSAAQSTRRDSSRDLTRTIDAEARVAMFELASGESFPALSRLEQLAALVGQDSSGVGQPERAALHFLLAQTYYRLGMLAAFRPEAEAAMAAERARYASVLRPQLLVEAYRSGDYARAASIAREMPASDANGGGALVAGLAAYQVGDLSSARAAFARATVGPFASYAKYMDALAQLRGDTAHAANAVASLEAAASGATGGFADQARLTAAQVAYEGERYDDAIRIAGTIGDSSALAAPALFTRAWSLYKVNRVADAERAFSDFVSRYPRRPEHDEAQLMAAQAQLELGRSTDAERVFQAVADSSAASVSMLQSQTNAAINDVARALVSNRSADLLAAGDPAGSKAVVLEDSTTAAGVLMAVGGAESSAARPVGQVGVAATNVSARLDSIAATAPAMVTRVLLAPASATRQPRELIGRSQSLAAADAAVSVTRYRLGEQLEGQRREIALLTQLAASLAADSAAILRLAADYATLADSMTRLDQLMAAAEARLRELLGREIESTRTLAAENARAADSLRAALAAGAGPDDRAAIEAEVATAASYARIADIAASGLDKAIARHPAFIARDSVRAHNAKAKSVLAELQGSYSGSRRDVDAALAALRGGDAPVVQRARQALSDAEARRAAVENDVIAAVTAELSARAAEMVASLQHSTEAAQFGVASAAFFRAIDGTRALGGGGTVGAVRSPAPERRR